MAHSREIALQRGEQIALGTALEDLTEKNTARFKHVGGKRGRGFRQSHDPDVIRFRVPDGRRRHVGEHHVGAPAAKAGLEQVFGRRIGKIHLDDVDACDRLEAQIVDGDHLALAVGRLGALGRNLRPTARRGTKVDDPLTRLQEIVLGIDFPEFERRAGPKSLPFCRGDVGIVQLTVEPAGG